jgi:hypothetical protein
MRPSFKITDPGTTGIAAGSLPGDERAGKNPYQVLEQARRQGKMVPEVVRENPVPDGEARIPWPAAGPTNDANRPPMRLG